MAEVVRGTPEQWAHLAAIAKDFRAAMGLTQQEVVDASERMLSLPVLQNLEAGRQAGYRPRALRGLARAFKWTDDSPERILAGGEPILRASAYGGDELSEVVDVLRVALERLERILVERDAPGFDEFSR